MTIKRMLCDFSLGAQFETVGAQIENLLDSRVYDGKKYININICIYKHVLYDPLCITYYYWISIIVQVEGDDFQVSGSWGNVSCLTTQAWGGQGGNQNDL